MLLIIKSIEINQPSMYSNTHTITITSIRLRTIHISLQYLWIGLLDIFSCNNNFNLRIK